jgi:hypothetical protein
MAISGGGAVPSTGPSFATIQGTGPGTKKGVVRLSKGSVVREGPGGMLGRKTLSFQRVPRNDAGFDAAKSKFLKELSKDPEVRKMFGEGSDELKALEQGNVPKGWEVHHNIPLTAKVSGVPPNDPSNFSLLPRWLHGQVTREWSNFLDSLAANGKTAGDFSFRIFDKFVH